MHFVFDMDGVICTPAKGIQFGIAEYVENCKPIANVSQFMNWLKENDHLIVIWCNRPNDLAVKLTTEKWLELNEIPYDRLLFDRPDYPIFVNETPCNSQYFDYDAFERDTKIDVTSEEAPNHKVYIFRQF